MSIDQTLITQSPFARQASEEPCPTATIIYHADLARIGEEVILQQLKQSNAQDISRLSPEFAQASSDKRRSIADPYISRKPLTLVTENGGLRIMKPPELTGNVTVNGRLLVKDLFIVGNEWRKGVVISMSNRVVLFIHLSPQRKDSESDTHGLLGDSEAIRKLRQVIDRVADLNVPVLIRGETGTGKELVAQAIHKSSQRSQQNFVSVNVAAIPESLAISELFGSKKGAFTGAAKDREGYFQQADKGTLFLDEIGDAHEQVQVALLRTLETGEVTPVGSNGYIHVDVRLIAATDADLEKSIVDDRFRSPLLQRLAGFEIRIPPLRKRRDDIGRLLVHFLTSELNNIGEIRHFDSSAQNISFWAGLFTKACLYDWPGNIRQLKNIAQQLAIYNREADFLTIPDHINELFSPGFNPAETNDDEQSPATDMDPTSTPPSQAIRRKPSTVTEPELFDALKAERWDLKATAEHLNISRAALYKMIETNASVRTAGDLSVEELQAGYQASNGNLDLMVEKLQVSKAALKRRLKDLGVH